MECKFQLLNPCRFGRRVRSKSKRETIFLFCIPVFYWEPKSCKKMPCLNGLHCSANIYTPNLQLLRIHAKIHWTFSAGSKSKVWQHLNWIPTLSHLYYLQSQQCNSYITLTSLNPSGQWDQTFELWVTWLSKYASMCVRTYWVMIK